MFYLDCVSLQKDNKNQRVMASIKVLLWKKKKADSVHPIVIRIIKNRKPSYIYTGQYIEEKHWDAKNHKVKKSHPNSARLNNFIAKKFAEANDKLLELEGKQDGVTSQLVTKEIKTERKASTFFELAKIYLEQLETQGQLNRLSGEKPRIKHFKKFLNHKDITFPEINEVDISEQTVPPISVKPCQLYRRKGCQSYQSNRATGDVARNLIKDRINSTFFHFSFS